ncbi:MAG: GTPase ObgE [Dehalococcoidia bacterium]|nr:GTPase ObgE [Dehalococcoidia bacterium]
MLDEIRIVAAGGRGGNGVVSFRRERYVPKGGPDGGDGGKGGAVTLEADSRVRVLDGLRRRRVVRASDGGSGGPAKRHGRNGENVVLTVPVGTIVWKAGRPERRIADLSRDGARVKIASGGDGGKGNGRMATSTRRAPRIAERGLAGEEVRLRLELRLLADVGLVGLPNAGKSSLLRAMSAAKPKVGAYPFTTLEPYLGVVEVGYEMFVVADIPGLIEGAHGGEGLGTAFLQHVRRTVLLAQVVDVMQPNPMEDIDSVRGELEAFGRGLAEKPWVAALNKIDRSEGPERARAVAGELAKRGIQAYAVSALTGEGVRDLINALAPDVKRQREAAEAGEPGELQVVRPRPVRRLEVARMGGGFEVRGDAPERAAAMLGAESEEARAELARRLRRMGVAAALRKAGVEPGDRVRVGEAELEWPL